MSDSRDRMGIVKVFVSSVIVGFEEERDAVDNAVAALGHIPIRIEDHPATAGTAQAACLAGVRDADVVVVILGERYGAVQQSGLSATHEEYLEARETRPVLVFVQLGASPEPKQVELIAEAQLWEGGSLTGQFTTPAELRAAATRALHQYELALESGMPDEPQLLGTARELLAIRQPTSETTLGLAVAPGPRRAVLRPSQLESNELGSFLLAAALTGSHAVLSTATGTDLAVVDGVLELRQPSGPGLVRLDESGNVLLRQSVLGSRTGVSVIASVIEEDVHEAIQRALLFVANVLQHVDSATRLSHFVVAATVDNANHVPWRTRAEQQASPSSATLSMRSNSASAVSLNPAIRRRPALLHEANQISDDLTVQLRRQYR